MTVLAEGGGGRIRRGRLLDRERTLAGPAFNRWLTPPAALAIHLCIGMAYGFSVFWLPMSRTLPGAAACRAGFMAELTSTRCNWSVADVTYIFETFIAVLGVSAAVFGGWLERAGPRKAGLIAAACWGGGLIIGGYGVSLHQLWLVFLGCGVVGGVGQGLGYITPVSTLIKWFPDRRGLATGLAIMGYGGGALVGSPLAVQLMTRFAPRGGQGVAATLIALGLIYFLVMTAAAFSFRVAPAGWRPNGWSPPVAGGPGMIPSGRSVPANEAWRTRPFWLLWSVLCLNVTAGIAVISMASPMLQEVFGGRLLGMGAGAVLSSAQRTALAASAAGLIGLISLFNSLGRVFWASVSDGLGRKGTYFIFFAFGVLLYGALPALGAAGAAVLFVGALCLILSFYGGGFATAPAYLADIFGPEFVGAIHGRLITAWSVAGVLGPALIARLRQVELEQGVAKSQVYNVTLYGMAGLLCIGLVCNQFVGPVAQKHFRGGDGGAGAAALKQDPDEADGALQAGRGAFGIVGVLAWLAVGLPFLWGLLIALQKAAALF